MSSPTGTVQFEDTGANLGSPAALIGGVAQLSTSGLSVGTHPITAVYSGDTNNATSTSNTVDQVVNGSGPPPPPATTVTPIPTLDPWGLIVAAALLLLTRLASFVLRRR